MALLPRHKTRIVCTIGPASQARGTLERMIRNGMDVARLNLAHGDFESHRATIVAIRSAAARVGLGVTLLADLPGPKLRVGRLASDQIELKQGQTVRLLALDEPESPMPEAAARMPTPRMLELPLTLPSFPDALKAGDDIFLDDGLIRLRVVAPDKNARPGRRLARVLVGGLLRSRDGVALPGIDLGISTFTSRDHELLAFALSEGIEAIGISFVQGPQDISAVREAAATLGFDPFIVAKIERAQAVERIDTILEVSDAIMVARGDLGVDIPIERITVAQKLLIARANAVGKPVITATQMLESMTIHRRPSRAEVADVSNAILDGTDCVMLSEETAIGRYPVEAVTVMSRVADLTERHLPGTYRPPMNATTVRGVLAEEATTTAERLDARYIIVPTETGTAARTIARLRPEAWIVAFSPFEETCRRLQFSRGVYPVFVPEAVRLPMSNWHNIARRWFREQKLRPGLAVMVQGDNRLEVIDLATGE